MGKGWCIAMEIEVPILLEVKMDLIPRSQIRACYPFPPGRM